VGSYTWLPFGNMVYPVTPTLSVEAAQGKVCSGCCAFILAAKLLGAVVLAGHSAAVKVVTFLQCCLLGEKHCLAASLAVTVKRHRLVFWVVRSH